MLHPAVGFYLFKRVNPLLLNTMALLAVATFTAATPWNRTLWGMVLTVLVNGIFMGMIDGGMNYKLQCFETANSCSFWLVGNMSILHLWGKESSSFLQGNYIYIYLYFEAQLITLIKFNFKDFIAHSVLVDLLAR